jgi:2-hydroxy-3-oxopropionate reductase
MAEESTIGFVGLGAMGTHMVRRLLDAGHDVAVYDTRLEALEPHVAHGAQACASAAAVANVAPTVLVSLPSPEVVRTVATGDHGLLGGSAMRTYVDLSTTGPAVAAEIAQRVTEAGIACLDAPVSGGTAGAEQGTLTIMAAGSPEVFAAAEPLLAHLGRSVVRVGGAPGQGQLAKVLNNLLSATAMAITSEAVALGVRGGLDPRTLVEVFSASTGRNSATEVKFPRDVLPRTFRSGFRMDLMLKDIELCLDEARRAGVPMPVGEAVGRIWSAAFADAAPGADHTELARAVEARAGVTLADEGADV